MTLSLVAVFIPLVFMGGMHGKLFREFSLTMAIAILVSGFISLTLTPMLCSRFLPTGLRKESPFQKWVNDLNQACVQKYGASLQWSFRHSKWILALAVALFAVAIPSSNSCPSRSSHRKIAGLLWLPYKRQQVLRERSSKPTKTGLNSGNAIPSAGGGFCRHHFRTHALFRVEDSAKRGSPPLESGDPRATSPSRCYTRHPDIHVPLAADHIELDVMKGGSYEYLLQGMHRSDVETAAEALKEALQKRSEFTLVD